MGKYKLTWDIIRKDGKREKHSIIKEGDTAKQAMNKIYIHSAVGKAVNFKAKKIGR